MFTDNGPVSYEVAVGTQPDSMDNASSWAIVGTDTFAVLTDLNLQNGVTYFVSVRGTDSDNQLSDTTISDGFMLDTYLPQVLAITEGSFTTDKDYHNNITSLPIGWIGSDNIEGPLSSGINFYEVALGTTAGDSNTVDWTNQEDRTSTTFIALSLEEGSTYYASARLTDIAGNLSEVQSGNGILIDSTSPVTGTVIDGTIEDFTFTGTSNALTATWSDFSDEVSGISHYEYAIGTSIGINDISGWISVGLDTTITVNGLSLSNGSTYIFSVKASDQAGNTSDVISTNGITVDTQAPDNNFIIDGLFTEDLDWSNAPDVLTAHWQFTDPLSGVASYQYAISNGSDGSQIVDWTDVGLDTFFTHTDLDLLSGTTYYISVRATDIVGNESSSYISDGITTDFMQPTVGVPMDGNPEEDMDWQAATDIFNLYWTASDNRNRELESFEYSISTTPGDSNVVAWTSSGSNSEISITGLSLNEAVIYYGNIRAYDAAGNRSSTISSDGITIDTTDPIAGTITDGVDEDITFTPSENLLEGHWSGFSDALSGIAYYHVAVGTSPGNSNIVQWQDVAVDTQVTFTSLNLNNGQDYYLSVKAFDQAHNVSDVVTSTGVVSDQQGPVSGEVLDGLFGDVEWVNSSSELGAKWENFQDALSGIEYYEYAVGNSSGSINVLDWSSAELATEILIQELPLNHGSQYFISVRGVDSVGNIGSYTSSNGLTVDLIPPTITDVIESENASIDVDYLNQADTVIISWISEDLVSGISFFETSLGTISGIDDVVSWTVLSDSNFLTNTLLDLGLNNGATYYASVRATDVAGNISEIISGDGVLIDLTAPVNGNVFDGHGVDETFTSTPDTLIASWTGFSDDISGIDYFEYAIGTSENGTEIVEWTFTETDTMSMVETGLSLIDAQKYFTSVRATDFAGNVSTFSVSDGIILDLTDMALVSSTISPESYISMIDPPTLSYIFTEKVDSGEVSIIGNFSGSISTSILDSSVNIDLIGPFASLDTFSIITSVNDVSGKDTLLLEQIFYTELLADYNNDLNVDVMDLVQFITAWNNDDTGYELGPVTGTMPHLIPELDNLFTIRDAMTFSRMWYWSNSSATNTIAMRGEVGAPIKISQSGRQITISLPDGSIASEIAIEYPVDNMEFSYQSKSSQDDEIVASKKFGEELVFMQLNGFITPEDAKQEKEIMFDINGSPEHEIELVIHYSFIGSGNETIGSGSYRLNYLPMPEEFSLYQNYPNPFNPSTTIKYDIPVKNNVYITIYDILGKEVITLINKAQEPGYKSIVWNGTDRLGQNVGSGVYFYTLHSGDFIQTKKLMLIK